MLITLYPLIYKDYLIIMKLVLYLSRSKLSTKWNKVVFCGKILDIFTINKVYAR